MSPLPDLQDQAAGQSAGQGALKIPAARSTAPKWKTLDVLKTVIWLLDDGICICAIKVMTTNIKPVSVAAAVPTMT
jgi:hypothetical protein